MSAKGTSSALMTRRAFRMSAPILAWVRLAAAVPCAGLFPTSRSATAQTDSREMLLFPASPWVVRETKTVQTGKPAILPPKSASRSALVTLAHLGRGAKHATTRSFATAFRHCKATAMSFVETVSGRHHLVVDGLPGIP